MTVNFTLIGADVEAYGHPNVCTEPAPGTVVSTENNSVMVNGTDIATVARAEMDIPTHCHDVDSDGNCINCYAHSIDPRPADDSPSVTVNGSPLYHTKDDVQDDPGTGSHVDIINTGGNGSVTES